jgi:hypothetical protein
MKRGASVRSLEFIAAARMKSFNSICRTPAFCVGQAKSGTGSLWGVLNQNFRAAHEPERSALFKQVLRRSRGEISDCELIGWLRERQWRLGLDIDIAWGNFFLLDQLLAAFPDAKFIVLVRDCYTWLDSIVGHMLTRDIPPDVRSFMEFWFAATRHLHGAAEQRLRDAGLFSLAAYLKVWREHVETCVGGIPPEQRLLVRTHELSASWDKIALFLGVDDTLLDPDFGHINRSTWSDHVSSLVDTEATESEVSSVCGDAMRRFFPEVHRLGDA